MAVIVSRELLAIDLRTYGEDALAERVQALSDQDLRRVHERADHYLYSKTYARPSGASMLIAKAVSLAAVDVIEGAPRPLRWSRRKLKGIYPGH